MATIFVGVDGGATKSHIRVEDEEGRLLGRAKSGPANIRISSAETWQAIYAGLNPIFNQHGLSLKEHTVHAGMGLAGLELEEAHQDFIRYAHDFHTLIVASDAHTACLGAHGGQDGAVVIAGTGVVGFQIEKGETTKVGGFGFPHDDIGGGAWLGLQAVQITLQWLDGRLPFSNLANAIYKHFQEDLRHLVIWANKANSTLFATLAPIVIQQSEEQDPLAISLMQQAASSIAQVGSALISRQKHTRAIPLPCVFLGGIARFLLPYLPMEFSARLRTSLGTADAGAIYMVRQRVSNLRAH
jgi:glucosamine kinase